MASRLDHLVVIATSLAEGADFVEQVLGVRPGQGRQHPNMGTHNLLLSLGDAAYVEVVAIDPHAAAPGRPRWFGLDGLAGAATARLAAWVANTDDIHALAGPELGDVEPMAREGHTWLMTMTADGLPPLAGAAPLLIQRASAIHPASRLPDRGLRLRRLRIRHPDPVKVARLLARIGLDGDARIGVEPAAACALAAEIETPAGPRTMGLA